MEISVDGVLGTGIGTLMLNEEKAKGQGISIRFEVVMGFVERNQFHKRGESDDAECDPKENKGRLNIATRTCYWLLETQALGD